MMIITTGVLISNPALSNQCTSITEVPFIIKNPGCYILEQDVFIKEPGQNAISIQTNDVKLDLNYHMINGPHLLKGWGNGIYANKVNNINIKNGTISGFLYGVKIEGGDSGENSNSISINDMIITNNYFRGILVEAQDARISNNYVLNTGGTEFFENPFPMAIEVKGTSCIIKNNKINGIYLKGVGEGLGISLSHERENCVVSHNQVSTPSSSNGTYGIWLSGLNNKSLVYQNVIEGFIFPFSQPVNNSELTVNFKNNILKKIACNSKNYKTNYMRLPSTNKFINNIKECPVLVHSLEKKYTETPNNPELTFLYATAKYQCNEEPRPGAKECCTLQKESILLFQAAADMGIYEAKRTLPTMKDVIKKYC